MFSSSGKQAQQAASGSQAAMQSEINQLENYANTAEANVRGGIAATGPNPYFTSSQALTPSAYAVNPNDTVTFGTGAGAPGVVQGAPTSITSAASPAAKAAVAPVAPVTRTPVSAPVTTPQPVGVPRTVPPGSFQYTVPRTY